MESCFVTMPIGDQEYTSIRITKEEMRKRYDDLIKEALLLSKENLEIYRADDISMPGSITNDIFMRLMHSTYVVADITYPNPNVFYELGIRHAISGRTILIKDKSYTHTVFDINHLRYIEYENTPSGLKSLSESFKDTFSWFEKNPQKPDNQFLELAALSKFHYPRFIDYEEEARKKRDGINSMLQPLFKHPELMKIVIDRTIPQEEKNKKFLEEIQKKPELFEEMFKEIVANGLIDRLK